MSTAWHTITPHAPVGVPLFVVVTYDENRPRAGEWLDLRQEPGRTNLSRQPRLRGWLGSSNNINRSASGMAVVVAVSKRTPSRARVEFLADDDPRVVAACEECGVDAD